MGLTHNLQEVLDRLEELERKAQKEIATNALNAGADILLEGQIETAPEDTGELKKSLDKGKIKGTGTKAKITVGIENASEDVVRYGYYQEYGTENMIGNKWMKKAWNKNIKQASEAIKESIVKDLTSK
ncbi:HK97 gp10 family phage protein [Romboutsia sp. 1001216sp1]|uniref:HK97-gp10 family putative phage morphogenesis protein n=1 Tax=unclassified Romboutsia TaxID=2626894 RepID=UPI0018AA31C5|nr:MULTISPECIES: HK97-gp10 family putative phage morphogenesis protein [unclassified Romboutsia]MDB8794273.1 HK97 gp10 family phage protein [Romboutsia sp. 1001216sp1]MDB8796442.1 HK97 gp10 family phage protein [Romboutsia sp. 1001216sp1]MDB8797805.1 HK97 gp10 family phage protein [Romboutsia sp. 1001216sp1]